MSEEVEMIVEIWLGIVEYLPDNDRVTVAHRLLEIFESNGYGHAVEELSTMHDMVEESLGEAVLDWV